jgi:hypothetical protein
VKVFGEAPLVFVEIDEGVIGQPPQPTAGEGRIQLSVIVEESIPAWQLHVELLTWMPSA